MSLVKLLMMTPLQLATALRGHGCDLTDRKLRLWRTNGLLPPLDNDGRGRASGVVRQWKDDAVFERAIIVYELLTIRPRVEFALLGIWYCGYEVDIAKVKKAWLSTIRRTEINLFGTSLKIKGKEDALGNLAKKLSRRLAPETGQRQDNMTDLLIEILNVFLMPSSKAYIDEGLATEANELLNLSISAHFSALQIQNFLEHIREHVSIDAMEQLIKQSTDEELRDAHQRWCKATLAIRRVSLVVRVDENQDELLQTGKRLKLAFGSLFIFAMLLAAKRGYGSKVDEYIEIFETSEVPIS